MDKTEDNWKEFSIKCHNEDSLFIVVSFVIQVLSTLLDIGVNKAEKLNLMKNILLDETMKN